MMLGDLGAAWSRSRPPGTATTPRLGTAVRRSRGRPPVDVLPLGQPQQGVDHPRPQGRRGPRRPAAPGRPGRRARGELPHRRARPPRPRLRDAPGAQPAPGRALDHRLRPRRARGRPRGLRPDRPGRGRADVADRRRARGPPAGRRPISDLLAGMYGAYGVLAALHERERTGRGTVVRTSLLAATVGVHAFQGTRWTVAGEVGGRPATTTPRSAPTDCSTAATARCRSRSAARGCGAGCATASARRRDPGPGHQPEAVAHRGRPSRSSRRRSPTGTRSRCWPGWPRSACPPARCGPWTRSTPGTRSPARACSSTSSTTCWDR